MSAYRDIFQKWAAWTSRAATLLVFGVGVTWLLLWLAGKFEPKVLAQVERTSESEVRPLEAVVRARFIRVPMVETATGTIRPVHAPSVNASKPPGEWQSFDIIFRAPRFDASGKKTANAVFVKVLYNGKVIHENVECAGPTRGAKLPSEAPTGPILLQGDHGPVAYRNFKLTPQ